MISDLEWDQYKRHLNLPNFGMDSQIALKNASVLVVGAGGLGCPILLYLTASGVGRIGIIDFDQVSIENLHRQVLFSHEDIGQFKVEVAANKLKKLNPFIKFQIFKTAIDYENVKEILADFQIIVDGSDNFATRYLLNDACVIYEKPYVYGAVYQFEGQVACFNIMMENKKRSCNYRDIYPIPPEDGIFLSCAEAGVLGVLPGIIGSVQALEVIKLITGIGHVLLNKTWIFNALTMESNILKISSKEPIQINEIIPLKGFCIPTNINEINYSDLQNWETNKIEFEFIDVRSIKERNKSHIGGIHIPLPELKEKYIEISNLNKPIVFYCQSGIRSKEAVLQIQQFLEGKIECYSLKGGLNQNY